MISVRHLTKHYRVHEKDPGLLGSLRSLLHRRHHDVVAVSDVSFDLADGEMVGFLGPNGAGKTTTLKMLSGLLYPTSGEVTVNGFVPQRRERAFLSTVTLVMGQKQQLQWDLSPADSLLVSKAIYGISDADYRQRLGELTELLEIGKVLRKPVRKLSLGERMKCEIAAALLHRPSVLFLDEPTIGLDVSMQQNVRRFFADYNRRHGATVLLTSHYMSDVTALAKRVLVIDGGELIFDGDLQGLVERAAPWKLLKLQCSEPLDRGRIERFGTVELCDGLRASLRVPRKAVTETASAILAHLPVEDIAIEDIPIEEVIAEVFRAERRVKVQAAEGATPR
ncbi:MAG TPA: ATP-binding cassette domain-containing protein [Hypericibacter adhaerens]|uniref:ABC transporter n=1 Tax=Hypericibacter adhaerens TaxID=2602016 RepID=A0A5J6MVY8_9PROT|nr:ATP-binding cassette domain-containing protein [Hypericibacter adhaerens]QEX21828.1 ABC transporter [Hypericibacter adhaerens]HWA46166.1 ATP-binding cassette domain-containing protein [Hypericibacter adhaerens]